MQPKVVGMNVDTLYLNVRTASDFPAALAEQLDALKLASQQADEDIPTPWTFAGEMLFIKAHGAGRFWRWILHCPSLHLDIGLGKRTGILGKARLSSAYLWEHQFGLGLLELYGFLSQFYHKLPFTLQVSEVHLCVDVIGWELLLDDQRAFVTRSQNRVIRLDDPEESDELPALDMEILLNRKRCSALHFSKGAPHSAVIYDKTAEIKVSRKDWMHVPWRANGWDGQSRVTRIEFRYKRECLKEFGIESVFSLLEKLLQLWAYSSKKWLRHTIPTRDATQTRWPSSPAWEAVQQATFYGNGAPGVRERKTKGDLTLILQMMAGCSSTAGALLTGPCRSRMTARRSSSSS